MNSTNRKHTMTETTQHSAEPKTWAQIRFIDQGDTLEFHAVTHDTEDIALKSHQVIKTISHWLPEILRAAGLMVISPEMAKTMPITDSERYIAMRCVAMMPDEEREKLLSRVGNPQTPEQFDQVADQMVRIIRQQIDPTEEEKPLVQAPSLKLVTP